MGVACREVGPRRLTTAACALAVALTCGAACSASSTGSSRGSVSSTRRAPSPTSRQPTTSGAPIEARGFRLDAASFVSDQVGWVLGQDGCLDCATVLSTTNGGRSWSRLPQLPDQPWFGNELGYGTADIVFADARSGFVFTTTTGPNGVLATHDAGRTWQPQRLPALQQLVAGNGYVFALTAGDQPTLWRARLGTATWTQLRQPHASGLSLAAQGATVLLLRSGHPQIASPGGDPGTLWLSTNAGTTWSPRTLPCRIAADGPAAVMSIADRHPSAWLIDCYNNEQSSQQQDTRHHLYGTADSGHTWVRLTDPAHHGAPALLADNGAGHALLATDLGFANTLYASLDGATSWHAAITSAVGDQATYRDLAFTSPATGYIAAPDPNGTTYTLYRTTDGGLHWNRLTPTT